MAFPIQEEFQKKMLEKVGVLPKPQRFPRGKDPMDARIRLLVNVLDYMRTPTISEKDMLTNALKRIEDLEKAVQELKKEEKIRKVPSKADFIYSKFKDYLEKEHFGKIVAIDVETEEIAGYGNSILEAYRDATRKQTTKNQFAYRRVGFDFVHKL